ncbi:MAG: photosynthetic reaction center subunit H [Erythrobacter sp.]
MNHAYIAGEFDVAELTFYLFFFFFIGLVLYLNRESRREGYPLEHEQTGIVQPGKPLTDGTKKVFDLPHGRGIYIPEDVPRDPVNVPGRQAFGAAGAPWVPTGNPLAEGMGPAAWADRAKYPDLTFDGRPRIIPIADSHDLVIAPNDPTPVGMPVYGADKKLAGKVSDVWVDQSEHIIRYLEVTTVSGKKVLAPMFVAAVRKQNRLFNDTTPLIDITAIRSDQFDDAPVVETAGQITRYEEDRIMAYFGGGYLYATPERSEPWL